MIGGLGGVCMVRKWKWSSLTLSGAMWYGIITRFSEGERQALQASGLSFRLLNNNLSDCFKVEGLACSGGKYLPLWDFLAWQRFKARSPFEKVSLSTEA